MRNNSVWGVVRDVLARNRAKTVFLAVTALASVLLALLPPQIMRAVIDRCLTPGVPDGLLRWALLYVAVVLLAGTSDFFKGALLTVDVEAELSHELFIAEELSVVSYGEYHFPGASHLLTRSYLKEGASHSRKCRAPATSLRRPCSPAPATPSLLAPTSRCHVATAAPRPPDRPCSG